MIYVELPVRGHRHKKSDINCVQEMKLYPGRKLWCYKRPTKSYEAYGRGREPVAEY